MPQVSGSQVIYQNQPQSWGAAIISPLAQQAGNWIMEAIKGPSPQDQYQEAAAQRVALENRELAAKHYQDLIANGANEEDAKNWLVKYYADQGIELDANDPHFTPTYETQGRRKVGEAISENNPDWGTAQAGVGDQITGRAPASATAMPPQATPAEEPPVFPPPGSATEAVAEANPTPEDTPTPFTAPEVYSAAGLATTATPPEETPSEKPPSQALSAELPSQGAPPQAPVRAAIGQPGVSDAARAAKVARLNAGLSALATAGKFFAQGTDPSAMMKDPNFIAQMQITEEGAKQMLDKYYADQGILPPQINLEFMAAYRLTDGDVNNPSFQVILDRMAKNDPAKAAELKQHYQDVLRQGLGAIKSTQMEAFQKLAKGMPADLSLGWLQYDANKSGQETQAAIAAGNQGIDRYREQELVKYRNRELGIKEKLMPAQIAQINSEVERNTALAFKARTDAGADVTKSRNEMLKTLLAARMQENLTMRNAVNVQADVKRAHVEAIAKQMRDLQVAKTALEAQNHNLVEQVLSNPALANGPIYKAYQTELASYDTELKNLKASQLEAAGFDPLTYYKDHKNEGADRLLQDMAGWMNGDADNSTRAAKTYLTQEPAHLKEGIEANPDDFRIFLGARWQPGPSGGCLLQGYDFTTPQLQSIFLTAQRHRGRADLTKQAILAIPKWKEYWGSRADMAAESVVKAASGL